ncbi:hypothetical protein [Nocardioides panacisoli]|uniref:Uncharacterized protein n=1 Tax=Nocardioides panacisoli TaxID=627624 RepID=A0ABP7IV42_9ACTN
MDLYRALRELIATYGPEILANPDGFRGILDDYFEETAVPRGEINLLVDAVRFGAVDALRALLDGGASPERAVREAGGRLARDRGGADVTAATWAVGMLGFATGLVPEAVVRGLRSVDAPPAAAETVVGDPSAALTVGAVPGAPTVARRAGDDSGPVRPASGDGRSRRRPVLVVLAVAVAVAIGVVGAVVVMHQVDDGGGAVAADQGSVAGSAVGNGRERKNATRRSDGPSRSVAPPTTASTSQAGDWTCWDGSLRPTKTDCGTPPPNLRGAHWLFAGPFASCISKRVPDRALHLECAGTPSSGLESYVKVSYWNDFKTAYDHYSSEGGAEEHYRPSWPAYARSAAPMLLWRVDDAVEEPCCPFKASVMYPSVGWSLTIYAQTSTDRLELLNGLTIEPPGFLDGHPV